MAAGTGRTDRQRSEAVAAPSFPTQTFVNLRAVSFLLASLVYLTLFHECFPQSHLDDNPNERCIPSLPPPPPRVVKLRLGCPARGSTPEGGHV